MGEVAVCGEVVTCKGGNGMWRRLQILREVAVHGESSSSWGGSDL